MKIGSKRSIAYSLGLLAVLGGAFAIFLRQGVPAAEEIPARFDLAHEREVMDGIIRQKGVEAAYIRFQTVYSGFNPVALHSLGHYLGQRIYERKGVEGVAICDDSYSLGCYHGLFSTAFTEEGGGAIAELAEICARLPHLPQVGSCVHGVGHGIMELHSYDAPGLAGALSDCDRVTGDVKHECWHGVFMEYNRRTPDAAGALAMRAFDPAHPQSPCDEVAREYRSACYVEQTAWWSMTMPSAGREDLAKKIGDLCAAVASKEDRTACWSGMGLMLPLGGADPGRDVQNYCLRLSPVEAAAACLKGGLRLMASYKKDPSPSLCDALPSPEAAACKKDLLDFFCAQGKCGE
jgi:hypothetical protein